MSGADDVDTSATSSRARRFDAMYRERIDPWNFRGSVYERDKYRATIDALPRPRYRRALEIGCSIGELARVLRECADEVLGLDVSPIAVEEARRVHGAMPELHFAVGEVPGAWPEGTWDLVVLSEMLYFLMPGEIDVLAEHVARSLEPGGHCVAVCWLGETDAGTDLGGDEAGARFAEALRSVPHAGISYLAESSRRDALYRLDVFERSMDPLGSGGGP